MPGEDKIANRVGLIEKGLGALLTPVDPDPKFIQGLETRLRKPSFVSMEGRVCPGPIALLVILMGLVVGLTTVLFLSKLRRV